MRILLVNDDGINADGIRILARRLSARHSVVVVAPESERSAAGHSYSFTYPLFLKKIEKDGYEGIETYITNGTPADCVSLGIINVCDRKLDLVVSGINAGANLGTDIPASGTVNAALEGAMHGIPAMAVSQEIKKLVSFDTYERFYSYAADFTADFIDREDMSVFTDHILSINFPLAESSEISGIKVCPVGKSKNDFFYHEQEDFVGRTHYWVDVKRTPKQYNENNKTDDYYLDRKYIVVTPVQYDMTAYGVLDRYSERLDREF